MASLTTGNLPSPLSSFIGREAEISEVSRLLSRRRLVTLVGPGGCGKTRLALQVAAGLGAGEFAQEIWLVEFAPLSDGALVPHAAASALGVQEQAGVPLAETLAASRSKKQALLIFDNCEHLIEACARLSAFLLEQCPRLRLLATSREPLGVPGEHLWAVPPLSLPGPQPWRNPGSEGEAFSAYQGSEAVQLFTARAAAAAPGFRLTPENGPWVAEICRRLDGLPLAIELAAARLRALSLRQIAERLDDRFRLLTGGLRTAAPRHKTLEAALDWSYELLPAAEQRVLNRLAVFAGSFSLEAAAAVCSDEAPSTGAAVELLANLVDKSMVEVEPFLEETRYRLLDTIRQYALRKLKQAGLEDATRERHLHYFTEWAEASCPYLQYSQQFAWLPRFDAEYDNIRAALEWSQADPSRVELGIRLASACGVYWSRRSFLSEGRARLATALAHYGPEHRDKPRARALQYSTWLAYLQSDYPATRALAGEALSLWQELEPDGAGVAAALDWLGELATEEGDYEAAPVYFERALGIYRRLNDLKGMGDMLMQLGWAAMRSGDYDLAETHLNESLAIVRQIQEPYLESLGLSGLGDLAVRQGMLGQATALLEESLKLRRALGHRWGIAATLGSLAWVALLQGDLRRMRALLSESLTIRLEIGDQGGVAWCLEKLAEGELRQAKQPPSRLRQVHIRAHMRRAAGLYGAAAALRERINSVIDPADRPQYEQNLNWLKDSLGEAAFQMAWDKGSSLPGEELLALALKGPEPPAPTPQPGSERFSNLSPREQETAALIAQGLSNREIAGRMVVGVKTVETYVTRILNKLGFDSRVQIATWAVETGLYRPETNDLDR